MTRCRLLFLGHFEIMQMGQHEFTMTATETENVGEGRSLVFFPFFSLLFLAPDLISL